MNGLPFETALMGMLGLKGRVVTKLVITCEVGKAPIAEVTEIAQVDHQHVTSTYEIGAPIREVPL